MPLTIPEGVLSKANWIVPHLKPLVDNVEAVGNLALFRADRALGIAQRAYVKLISGIPEGDLDAEVVRKLNTVGDGILPDGSVSPAKLAAGGTLASAGASYHGDGKWKTPSVSFVQPISTKTASYRLVAGDMFSHIRLNLSAAGGVVIPNDTELNVPVGSWVELSSEGPVNAVISAAGTASGTVSIGVSNSFVKTSATSPLSAVPFPTGFTTGSAILVECAFASTSASITWPTIPAGFQFLPEHIGPSGAGHSSFLAKNITAASFDGQTLTWDSGQSGGTPTVWIVTEVKGVNATDPLEAYSPITRTTSSSISPTLVTQAPGVLEVAAMARSTGSTIGDALPAPPVELTTIQARAHDTTPQPYSQLGVASLTAGPVAAGTTIGGRQWTVATGSTGTGRTFAFKPSVVPSVQLDARGSALTFAGRYGMAYAKKVAANRWIIAGDLVA